MTDSIGYVAYSPSINKSYVNNSNNNNLTNKSINNISNNKSTKINTINQTPLIFDS